MQLMYHSFELPVFQEHVLRHLKTITAQLECQGKVLRRLEAQQQETKRKGPCTPPVSNEICKLLPLATHEDLLRLEKLLEDEGNTEALVCSYIHSRPLLVFTKPPNCLLACICTLHNTLKGH